MFGYLTEIVQANVLSLYVNEPDEVFTCTKHNFHSPKVNVRGKFATKIVSDYWRVIECLQYFIIAYGISFSAGSIFDFRSKLGLSSCRILNQKLLLRGADLCTPNVCLRFL